MPPTGIHPSVMPPFSPHSGLPSSPFHQLLNSESYMADTLTPVLVDFPPIGVGQDYLHAASRFFPRTRSATEEV